ncbi:Xylose-responsive transcription regulator, ROK family [Olavius sp. associated proteobacterium Delta 1]|nr:Xylose-responsive transcription regulator, ROK family [Olavius sp. associated proteobacterium Delta 1]
MEVSNREFTKTINQFNILDTIRRAGLISRVEIAEKTGQSRAAVTNITARLLNEKVIVEKETKTSSSRGRRRVLLALNPTAAYVVGVKLSAFQVSFAVTNMQADVLSSLIVPVRIGKKSVEFVADLIEEGIRHCVSEALISMRKISGIGIGIPGLVSSKKGITYWSALYRKGNTTLRNLIQQRFNIQTYIENDANTVTLAQQWFGEGKGIDNFLVVTVEHGVGMGIVVNGQIYRGVKGIGAEFGHMVIKPGGAPCRCGKHGCIESYVADYSILGAAIDACKAGKWQYKNRSSLTIEEVTAIAKKGEPALQKIFKRSGEILGLGISGLVQIFNPAKIIIAGEGVRSGALLFEPMQKMVKAQTTPEMYETLQIVIQKWQDTDWARGAASLVLQELYKSPLDRARPAISEN